MGNLEMNMFRNLPQNTFVGLAQGNLFSCVPPPFGVVYDDITATLPQCQVRKPMQT
jgi:hypothetical protein